VGSDAMIIVQAAASNSDQAHNLCLGSEFVIVVMKLMLLSLRFLFISQRPSVVYDSSAWVRKQIKMYYYYENKDFNACARARTS
jgi:hypothetical protein